MEPIIITTLAQVASDSSIYSKLEAVFFETTTRTEFIDAKERADFRYSYLDIYYQNPNLVFLALDASQKELYGYLVASDQTDEEQFKLHPYLENFRTEIESQFPAHLHINCTASSRGKGIGSKLISALEEKLKSLRIQGVYLITVEGEANVNFYLKNGYTIVSKSKPKNATLLFMGKTFNS